MFVLLYKNDAITLSVGGHTGKWFGWLFLTEFGLYFDLYCPPPPSFLPAVWFLDPWNKLRSGHHFWGCLCLSLRPPPLPPQPWLQGPMCQGPSARASGQQRGPRSPRPHICLWGGWAPCCVHAPGMETQLNGAMSSPGRSDTNSLFRFLCENELKTGFTQL